MKAIVQDRVRLMGAGLRRPAHPVAGIDMAGSE